MNYLFINTAEGTRVLVRYNGKYEYFENLKNAGAETLMPAIDGALKTVGAKLSDMDIFGACIGPGSFTGLRVGLATVKTFCYALDKPCFAVNNLRLNSYNNKSERVISVADAGSNVCYIARYDGENELDGAKCVTTDDAKRIIESNKDFSVSTDIKLSTAIKGVSGVDEREMRLAAERFMDNRIGYKELLPLYVRKAQPERGAGDL